MNKEKQRIAIAEACGWTRFGESYPNHDDGKEVQWCLKAPGSAEVPEFMLPDYLNDLNAMHEAEKTIDTDTYYVHFLENLSDIVCKAGDSLKEHTCNYHRAEAYQRAEAFLKTIGKWVD